MGFPSGSDGKEYACNSGDPRLNSWVGKIPWRRKWQPTRGLAWRIPGTGEPGRLPSMGSHRVGHDWSVLTVQLSHPYMTTGKTIALARRTFVGKVMSLILNMLSRLVITFHPRNKHLLISWLQSPSVVILEPRKIKSDTVSTVSPSISHEVMGLDAMIFVFWMLSFKLTFSLSTFTFIKRLFSSSSLSAIRVVSSAYLRWLIFLLANLSSSRRQKQAQKWHLDSSACQNGDGSSEGYVKVVQAQDAIKRRLTPGFHEG